MIVTSTSQPVPFTPPWRETDENPPRYFFRAGDVIARGLFEAELAGEYRAGIVYDFQLLAEFRAGIDHLLADHDDRGVLIDLAQAEADGEALTAADLSRLVRARELLAEHWPAFAALQARAERRAALAPVLAFRRFCIGWENLDEAFARGADGLVDAKAMRAVPPLDLQTAGSFAYGLLYGGTQRGNSSAPAKSEGGRRTSRSGAKSRAAGSSPESAG